MHTTKKSTQISAPALLCLVVALLFSACNTSPTRAPSRQQVYTAPLILPGESSDLATLDPALAYDQNSLTVVSLLYTGLVQFDDHLQPQPQLARSWDLSPDGLTWTFHLKPNLTFSDGTPLTATDVIYSLDRALQPATKSSVAPIYLGVINDADKLLNGNKTTLIGDSLQAVNPSTVQVTTAKPVPYFPQMLAHACAYVVEQQTIKTYGNTFTDHLDTNGGSGPFIIRQYTHGQSISFVPNPRYYGPKPQLNNIVFRLYRQAEAAYNDYAAGKVDTTPVPLAQLPDLSSRPDYHQAPLLWINYYTMNYKVAPFDNISIRQAFALAIDKTALAQDVWKNTVTPTNHIIPQGMPGYNSNLAGPDGTQNLTGNATKAKALFQQGLRQEHWSGVSQVPPITLTYATGSPETDQEVQKMISMWRQVLGITVKASPVAASTLLGQVAAATDNTQGAQMWGISWVAEYPDPQDWLSRQFGQGSAFNNMNYGQNASSDATRQLSTQTQLADADTMASGATRLQAYQRAEQQLVNDVAWLPVEQVNSIFLRKGYVAGIIDNGLEIIPPNDWANIYILQH